MKGNTEIWKPVPSLPGVEASSLGRIRKRAYTKSMPNGGTRVYQGKPTFGVWVEDEQRFTYRYKGDKVSFKVHFAVCEAFNGPRPFPLAVVMHDDENGANNRADNLKWGTQKENLNYAGFLAYCKTRVGEKSTYAKWRAKQKRILKQSNENSPEVVQSACG